MNNHPGRNGFKSDEALAVRPTREQLARRIDDLRARLVQRERDRRRSGEEIAEIRHELTRLQAALRIEPPTVSDDTNGEDATWTQS